MHPAGVLRGRIKTQSQLCLAATMANLTLVLAKWN